MAATGVSLSLIYVVMLISPLLFALEGWRVKPTYRKSLAGNLLMWSDLTLDPSFKVKLGQPNVLKSAYNSLIIGPRVL